MKKIIIVILIILVIMAIVSTIILINTKNRDIKGNNDFIENLIQENKIENTSYAINEINEIVQNSINEKKNEILEKDIKPVDDFSSTTNVKQDLSKIQDKSTNFKDSKTPIKNEQTKKENMSKDNIKVDEDKETNKTSTTQNTCEPEKKCTATKHAIEAGNTGKWFNSKAECDDYYNQISKYWGDKWKKDEITMETYEKNCPYGYECWTCYLCGKWTVNFYYN